MNDYICTDKTRLKRLPARGAFDRTTVHAILDEAFVCHIGFTVDGQPYVIPTAYGRVGDTLYLHGSAASRLMRSLSGGIPICVTVTLVDGLVLARSAFHHSINYRSVVIFGRAEQVTDDAEKMDALAAFTEHLLAGRWAEARVPNAQELKATTVLRLALEEVSAKVRTGPPKDDEEDYAVPVWAGVLPLRVVADRPITDNHTPPEMNVPAYVLNYERG